MSIRESIIALKETIPQSVSLVAVSKFHPASDIQEAYDAGHRIFGESRVQELMSKYEVLPKDIEWHFIGHLQGNKVKYIAPFIHLIHSVDSLSILKEIDKQARLAGRKIPVLLQIHIAQEETKYGFAPDELEDLLRTQDWKTAYPNVTFAGLMGMATFTDDVAQINAEFESLATLFTHLKTKYFHDDADFKELSMGMSDDYPLAIEKGSTLVRIGSKIFGVREY